MYQPINDFLLLKPYIDTGNTPEFLKLFNSTATKYKVERMWMLKLLEDGLREMSDYQIFQKRHTFKLILSLHDSALGDQASRVICLITVTLYCYLVVSFMYMSVTEYEHETLLFFLGTGTESADEGVQDKICG